MRLRQQEGRMGEEIKHTLHVTQEAAMDTYWISLIHCLDLSHDHLQFVIYEHISITFGLNYWPKKAWVTWIMESIK